MVLSFPITTKTGNAYRDADVTPSLVELKRTDTGEVLAAAVPMTWISEGRYRYIYADAVPGVTYTYTVTATVAGYTDTITKSITAPLSTDLAVTLEQVKKYLRLIDDGENDQNLLGMLTAAIGYVQDECDLTLMPTPQALVLDHFPRHHEAIRLPIGPALSVQSIQYDNAAGERVTLPTTAYRFTEGLRFGQVKPMGHWPATPRHTPNSVTIRYTSGYASREAIPPVLVQAVKMIVAGWFSQAPEAWTDRAITETPALTRILNLYRSYAIAV